MFTCHECGNRARFTVPGSDDDLYPEPDTYWCTEHAKNRVDARELITGIEDHLITLIDNLKEDVSKQAVALQRLEQDHLAMQRAHSYCIPHANDLLDRERKAKAHARALMNYIRSKEISLRAAVETAGMGVQSVHHIAHANHLAELLTELAALRYEP